MLEEELLRELGVPVSARGRLLRFQGVLAKAARWPRVDDGWRCHLVLGLALRRRSRGRRWGRGSGFGREIQWSHASHEVPAALPAWVDARDSIAELSAEVGSAVVQTPDHPFDRLGRDRLEAAEACVFSRAHGIWGKSRCHEMSNTLSETTPLAPVKRRGVAGRRPTRSQQNGWSQRGDISGQFTG